MEQLTAALLSCPIPASYGLHPGDNNGNLELRTFPRLCAAASLAALKGLSSSAVDVSSSSSSSDRTPQMFQERSSCEQEEAGILSTSSPANRLLVEAASRAAAAADPTALLLAAAGNQQQQRRLELMKNALNDHKLRTGTNGAASDNIYGASSSMSLRSVSTQASSLPDDVVAIISRTKRTLAHLSSSAVKEGGNSCPATVSLDSSQCSPFSSPFSSASPCVSSPPPAVQLLGANAAAFTPNDILSRTVSQTRSPSSAKENDDITLSTRHVLKNKESQPSAAEALAMLCSSSATVFPALDSTSIIAAAAAAATTAATTSDREKKSFSREDEQQKRFVSGPKVSLSRSQETMRDASPAAEGAVSTAIKNVTALAGDAAAASAKEAFFFSTTTAAAATHDTTMAAAAEVLAKVFAETSALAEDGSCAAAKTLSDAAAYALLSAAGGGVAEVLASPTNEAAIAVPIEENRRCKGNQLSQTSTTEAAERQSAHVSINQTGSGSGDNALRVVCEGTECPAPGDTPDLTQVAAAAPNSNMFDAAAAAVAMEAETAASVMRSLSAATTTAAAAAQSLSAADATPAHLMLKHPTALGGALAVFSTQSTADPDNQSSSVSIDAAASRKRLRGTASVGAAARDNAASSAAATTTTTAALAIPIYTAVPVPTTPAASASTSDARGTAVTASAAVLEEALRQPAEENHCAAGAVLDEEKPLSVSAETNNRMEKAAGTAGTGAGASAVAMGKPQGGFGKVKKTSVARATTAATRAGTGAANDGKGNNNPPAVTFSDPVHEQGEAELLRAAAAAVSAAGDPAVTCFTSAGEVGETGRGEDGEVAAGRRRDGDAAVSGNSETSESLSREGNGSASMNAAGAGLLVDASSAAEGSVTAAALSGGVSGAATGIRAEAAGVDAGASEMTLAAGSANAVVGEAIAGDGCCGAEAAGAIGKRKYEKEEANEKLKRFCHIENLESFSKEQHGERREDTSTIEQIGYLAASTYFSRATAKDILCGTSGSGERSEQECSTVSCTSRNSSGELLMLSSALSIGCLQQEQRVENGEEKQQSGHLVEGEKTLEGNRGNISSGSDAVNEERAAEHETQQAAAAFDKSVSDAVGQDNSELQQQVEDAVAVAAAEEAALELLRYKEMTLLALEEKGNEQQHLLEAGQQQQQQPQQQQHRSQQQQRSQQQRQLQRQQQRQQQQRQQQSQEEKDVGKEEPSTFNRHQGGTRQTAEEEHPPHVLDEEEEHMVQEGVNCFMGPMESNYMLLWDKLDEISGVPPLHAYKSLTWTEGFSLPLGKIGRQKLLRQVRLKYHRNREHWRARLHEKGFDVTSLPRMGVEQLWAVAQQMDLFDVACIIAHEHASRRQHRGGAGGGVSSSTTGSGVHSGTTGQQQQQMSGGLASSSNSGGEAEEIAATEGRNKSGAAAPGGRCAATSGAQCLTAGEREEGRGQSSAAFSATLISGDSATCGSSIEETLGASLRDVCGEHVLQDALALLADHAAVPYPCTNDSYEVHGDKRNIQHRPRGGGGGIEKETSLFSQRSNAFVLTQGRNDNNIPLDCTARPPLHSPNSEKAEDSATLAVVSCSRDCPQVQCGGGGEPGIAATATVDTEDHEEGAGVIGEEGEREGEMFTIALGRAAAAATGTEATEEEDDEETARQALSLLQEEENGIQARNENEALLQQRTETDVFLAETAADRDTSIKEDVKGRREGRNSLPEKVEQEGGGMTEEETAAAAAMAAAAAVVYEEEQKKKAKSATLLGGEETTSESAAACWPVLSLRERGGGQSHCNKKTKEEQLSLCSNVRELLSEVCAEALREAVACAADAAGGRQYALQGQVGSSSAGCLRGVLAFAQAAAASAVRERGDQEQARTRTMAAATRREEPEAEHTSAVAMHPATVDGLERDKLCEAALREAQLATTAAGCLVDKERWLREETDDERRGATPFDSTHQQQQQHTMNKGTPSEESSNQGTAEENIARWCAARQAEEVRGRDLCNPFVSDVSAAASSSGISKREEFALLLQQQLSCPASSRSVSEGFTRGGINEDGEFSQHSSNGVNSGSSAVHESSGAEEKKISKILAAVLHGKEGKATQDGKYSKSKIGTGSIKGSRANRQRSQREKHRGKENQRALADQRPLRPFEEEKGDETGDTHRKETKRNEDDNAGDVAEGTVSEALGQQDVRTERQRATAPTPTAAAYRAAALAQDPTTPHAATAAPPETAASHRITETHAATAHDTEGSLYAGITQAGIRGNTVIGRNAITEAETEKPLATAPRDFLRLARELSGGQEVGCEQRRPQTGSLTSSLLRGRQMLKAAAIAAQQEEKDRKEAEELAKTRRCMRHALSEIYVHLNNGLRGRIPASSRRASCMVNEQHEDLLESEIGCIPVAKKLVNLTTKRAAGAAATPLQENTYTADGAARKTSVSGRRKEERPPGGEQERRGSNSTSNKMERRSSDSNSSEQNVCARDDNNKSCGRGRINGRELVSCGEPVSQPLSSGREDIYTSNSRLEGFVDAEIAGRLEQRVSDLQKQLDEVKLELHRLVKKPHVNGPLEQLSSPGLANDASSHNAAVASSEEARVCSQSERKCCSRCN